MLMGSNLLEADYETVEKKIRRSKSEHRRDQLKTVRHVMMMEAISLLARTPGSQRG